MAGSSFGTILRVTTWGESHGPAIGCVLDGFPAGMNLSEDDIQPYLDKRKPGQSELTTQRKESDTVHILSGVFEGRTTGAPISLLIHNSDQHSQDYADLRDCYRPGHADYTYEQKYGIRDYRGGGRSSARETAARVAAGAIAEKFLKEMGITFSFYTASIGDVVMSLKRFDPTLLYKTRTNMPDPEGDEKAAALIEECRKGRDSVGGMVKGVISGVPAGLGDPVFHRLDADLAGALMSINAAKEVGIGDGIFAGYNRGSENNDAFYTDEQGKIQKRTNHAGGILGGISDGSDIIVSTTFKPTPSISLPQETVTRDGVPKALVIHGRHDPCVVPRAVIVCETMSALVILDAMLRNMSAKAENVKKFYGREAGESDDWVEFPDEQKSYDF
jgi:chorismate synthase